MPELWERQPNETARAYVAFTAYRDMPHRSLQKLTVELGKGSAYVRQLETWSSKYSWVIRVQAYDDHIERVAQKATEETVVDIARRQAREARFVQTESMEILEELLKRRRDQKVPFKDLKDSELIKAIRDITHVHHQGIELERLALGMATENLDLRGKLGIKQVNPVAAAVMRSKKARDAVLALAEEIDWNEDDDDQGPTA